MTGKIIYPKYGQVRSSYRPVIRATTGIVASGHHLATQAGMRILEKGGNAIDAGVATGICLNVLQSDMVSFAGVAPMIIYRADTNELRTISGLGPWPKAASVDYFIKNFSGEIPLGIPRTVVPAAPDAWIQALRLYGTMSFEKVSRDAIELAEHGFPMHQFMSNTIKEKIANYQKWPTSIEIYLPKGRPPEPGEVFVQKDLAQTIKKMVKAERKRRFSGRDEALQSARNEFYRGEIAEAILDFHLKNDGLLRREDLEHFQVKIEKPLETTYKEYEIFSCGFWCQGPVLLQTLNLLERLDLRKAGHNSADYIHCVTEALKLVFADREKFYGDPEFVDVPAAGLLAKEYAEERGALIERGKAWPEMPPAGNPWDRGGKGKEHSWGSVTERAGFSHCVEDDDLDTTYLCVVDKYGNSFSCTPSDGSYNSPVVSHTGLVVSPRGSQSWADDRHVSSIQGGKRPRLTPNPAMVFRKGRLFMPLGSPGGDVQCQAMLQTFLNIAEFHMDPQEAVEAPRFATSSFPSSFFPHDYYPGLLRVEERIQDSALRELEDKGHKLAPWPEWAWRAGGVCCIVVDSDNGILLGAADPRRECYAFGW